MLRAIAPALRSRNFRLFWIGQIISIVGTSIQVVAEGYLIYDLTGSTFWLGMVGFLALLPVVPISLLGGVLIDRVPRRKLILITQTILLVQAAVFGLLAISGSLQLWNIILLYFVFGAALAIDHPARRAFLVELVGEEELANAVALNATVYNMSSLIGYALAGLMIAALGAGTTMLFNAATYLAPITALLLIHVPDVAAENHAVKLGGAIWEGIQSLWRQPEIMGVMVLMAIVGGMANPVFGLMPAYAKEVAGVGAIGLGILMAAGALGSILGTALVTYLGRHRRGKTLTLTSFLLPALVAAFAFARQMWVACLVLVAIGIVLLIMQSLAITLVQLHTENRVRGRVMSVYSLLHAGADTIGNVVVGSVAVPLSLPSALAVGALTALACAVGLRAALPGVARMD